MDEQPEQAQEAAQTETEVVTEPVETTETVKVETPAPDTKNPTSPTERYKAAIAAKKAAPVEAKVETDEQPSEVKVDDTETGKEDKILPNRINTSQFSETEKEAIALLRELKKEDPNANLKDAYVIIEQRKATETQPEQVAEEAAPAEPNFTRLAEIEASLPELQAEYDTLTEEIENVEDDGELYNKAHAKKLSRALKIQSEISKLSKEGAELSEQLKQFTETQNAKANAVWEQAREVAIQEYPSLGIKGSELQKLANALVEEYSDPNHPNHAVLKSKDSLVIVADTAARQHAREVSEKTGKPYLEVLNGLRVQAQTTETKPEPKAEKPKVPQPKKITPVGGNNTATPQPKQLPAGWENWSPTQQYAHRMKEKGRAKPFGISV